jgi:uncharacterized protein involved in type VI secretion and phage assembly
MRENDMAQLPGVYRGVIVNAADPAGDGRVQVRIPALAMATTMWADVCTPFGAPRNATPTIGGEVLVAFEGGSVDHPIVLGAI